MKMSREDFMEGIVFSGEDGKLLNEEHLEETRWAYEKRYAVEIDGKLYLADVEFPATEYQEVYQDEIELRPAKAVTKTVTTYVLENTWVKPS